MKTMECTDKALLATAHILVEKARQESSFASFADVVARAESSPWPGLAMTPNQRKRLRVVMNEIWLSGSSPADETHELPDLPPSAPMPTELVS